LHEFHPKLSEKPYIIALNKADLGVEETLKIFKEHGELPIVTSAISGEGCESLKLALDKLVVPKNKKAAGWAKKP
jgi:GTP-binding protein